MKLMRTHYIDASAIVKLFIDEDGSETLRKYFKNESNFFTTSLCFVEALGVFKVKCFYKKEITDEEYFYACESLLEYAVENIIEIEDVKIKGSMAFVEVEKLVRKHKETIDVSDAFQIVSVKANFFSQFKSDSQPILITGDKKLAAAARSEGIRVWDCVNEPEPDLSKT